MILEKSQFHVSTITFLGFMVSQDSLRMDPLKNKVVKESPQPSSVCGVQHFLVFIRKLRTKKTQDKYLWTAVAQEAFEALKKRLTLE